MKNFMLFFAALLLLMGTVTTTMAFTTTGNNFTMNNATGGITGGTNDVVLIWDGTVHTPANSTTLPGVSNATMTSNEPFQAFLWFAHGVEIVGTGPLGGTGAAASFGTDVDPLNKNSLQGFIYQVDAPAGTIAAHMLFDWGARAVLSYCCKANCDIDLWNVYDSMKPYQGILCGYDFAPGTNTCGDYGQAATPITELTTKCHPILPTPTIDGNPNVQAKIWNMVSIDISGRMIDTSTQDYVVYEIPKDAIPGIPFEDGPFAGFNGNFNFMFGVDGCVIGGTTYPDGTTNPANPCQVCDTTQSTTGWSPMPAGTACGGSNALCDALDTCNGAGTCIDNVKPVGTVCRAAAGVCDIAATCDGTSTTCPVINTFAPLTNLCRPPVGVCDVPEYCTGTSAECPPDAFAPSSTVCRSSAGVCDVQEHCTGTSATCPADVFAPSTTACSDGLNCTVGDHCSGTSMTCVGGAPFCPTGMSCIEGNPPACCINTCTVATQATSCNDNNPCTRDICIVVNGCSECNNVPDNAGTVCRPAAGVCDVAETCTGTSALCPVNAFKPNTTVCRASAGVCDVAETCTGTSAACPADAFAPSTTSCTDNLNCTVNDHCSGTANTCISGTPFCTGAGEVCIEGNPPTCAGNPCTCDLTLCTLANACNVASCDLTTPAPGACNCIYTPKPAGTACEADGNSCTTDACNATGTCVAGPAAANCSSGNNFSMAFPATYNGGMVFGGTNDVRFTWNGTVHATLTGSNATISSDEPFNGFNWQCRNVEVVGSGTQSVDPCAGGPGSCVGLGAPAGALLYQVDIPCGKIGAHMLFDWGQPNPLTACGFQNCDIDVWNVWDLQKAAQYLFPGPDNGITNTGGFLNGKANTAATVWSLESIDAAGRVVDAGGTLVMDLPLDGVAGLPMADGPFQGFNANFNVMANPDKCAGKTFNDNNVCTDDYCNPATGTILTCNNTATCSDGNFCTKTDVCSGGQCVGTGDPCAGTTRPFCNETGDRCDECRSATDCNDSNICTADACNTATGSCSHTATVPAVCNDNNICTTDTCSNNTCGNTQISGCCRIDADCLPGYHCMSNACIIVEPPCTSVNVGMACNDNNACTANDKCVKKTVNRKTVYVCQGTTVANGTACTDDGNKCTTDTCQNAVCTHTAKNCNDNNACTTDSCNTATGQCVYTAVVCNDNNSCTTDTCVPATGCKYTTVANGTACNDGNLCTENDKCSSGVCKGMAKNCNDHDKCTTDSCNPATGQCVNTFTGKTSVTLLGDQTSGETATYNKQIQTIFTVSNAGPKHCILSSTNNYVYVTGGTTLDVNCKAGTGPMPTTGKLDGVSMPVDAGGQVQCPTDTTVHTIYLDNKAAKPTAGKDVDNLKVYGQTCYE